tara:strand:- start:85 stop:876 length:792 start_codon:yes stop_codon:yes gene_type:complete
MNVKEAVRRLNGFLQRRGKVDGSGGWTEQYLLDLLTDANMDMYHRAVNYGPEIFQLSDKFTYDANATEIDLNSKVSGLPMAIWYLGVLSKDEELGPNNLPVPIQMVRRTNLDASGGGGNSVTSSTGFTGPYGGTAGAITLPGSFSIGGGGGGSAYQGYYLGKELSVRPVPSQDTHMYMRWTPDELSPLVDEDQELLNGFLPQFHPAIVYKAAIQAKSAKGEDTTQLIGLYQDTVGQHDANVKMGCRQRQRQQPQQRDPMRWEY